MNLHIIGAGPAGLLLARECSELFENVYIYEEHQAVGEPEHCTGLVSEKLLHLVPEATRYVLGKFREIIVTNEKFRPIAELRLEEPAVLIDRREFERELAHQVSAQDNVKLLLKRRVMVELRGDQPVLLSRGQTVRCEDSIVAVCEGSVQEISWRILRFRSESFVYGLQCDAYLRKRVLDYSTIIVILPDKFSHEYFAWIVPIEHGRARIGVGYINGPGVAYLRKLAKSISAVCYRMFGGKILLSRPPRVLGVKRLVFLGDTVSQTKPLTGGGVLMIALTAKLLSAIFRYVLELNMVNRVGEIYSRVWHRLFRRYITGVTLLRKVLYSRVTGKMLDLWTIPIRFRFYIDDFDLQSRYISKFVLSCNYYYLTNLLKKLCTITT